MTRLHRWLLLCAVMALGAFAAGCPSEENEWDTDVLVHGGESVSAEVLRKGRDGYERYCIGCHGESGDGQGPAARFLDPKPRDFREGKIKFALVAAGEVPRDDDLLAVITEGLHGTSMPSWRFVPLAERRAIVQYLKTFSDRYAKKGEGVTVAIGKDPWRGKADKAIAEGERVYHGIAGCYTCHAAYVPRKRMYEHLTSYDIKVEGFRDDLYLPIAKDSQWGAPITPPDFLTDAIKTGYRKEDIVKVISAGVGGTAMPTWAGGLTDRQLWGLAYYVESLALLRGTPQAAQLQRDLRSQEPFEIPAPPPAPEPTPEPETTPEGDAP